MMKSQQISTDAIPCWDSIRHGEISTDAIPCWDSIRQYSPPNGHC